MATHLRFSDSEEEVFGLGGEEDSETDGDSSDIAVSDVEDGENGDDDEEDGLPDIMAWGKNKKNYYSTDYIDQDYGGYQEKDAQKAEIEEKEALAIQDLILKRFNNEFTENIPSKQPITEVFFKKTDEDSTKASPVETSEFSLLTQDFRDQFKLLQENLRPVIIKYKKGQIPNSKAMEFISTYHEIILNYCTNIYMYVLLVSSGTKTDNHPIMKRLSEYKLLLTQIEPVYNEILAPQIPLLLSDEQDEPKSPKKVLRILSDIVIKPADNVDTNNGAQTKKSKKKVKFSGDKEVGTIEDVEFKAEEEQIKDDDVIGEEEEPDDGSAKRPLTYKIAKNKGLTPHRKKEQRNPRVKHRNKFKKAKIRRKGAVREVRTELSRYGGEISGIKASVSKSVRLG